MAMGDDGRLLLSSLLMGLAVAGLAWAAIAWIWRPPAETAPATDYERARRDRLRAGDSIYRNFESLVERRAIAARRGLDEAGREALAHQIAVAAVGLPWSPEQYIGMCQVSGGLVGACVSAAVAGVAVATAGPRVGIGPALLAGAVMGALLGLTCALAYPQIALQQLAERARKRARAVTARLPFAVDLLTLMMGAGAGFTEALEVVVRENRGLPLADELGEVLNDIALGTTRRNALEDLGRRLHDEDISEFVFAVVKAEELGTPLVQSLRSQAQQLRLKRSQWMEKASSEAQVKIVFPGMIVMVACLLVIVAPFVLNAASRLF